MTLAGIERAAHLIGLHVEQAARDLAITQAEAHILVSLARRGPTSIADLHREFGTKRSTLTNVLDRLESRGLVRRELNPKDRRSFTIYLTPRGAGQARRLRHTVDELDERLRGAVSKKDLESVEKVVDALAAMTLLEQPPDAPRS
jgi:DNA-binding MarR family transcriptional regulator